MAANLNTKQLYITQPTVQQPPALTVSFPKPLTYEFRVVEWMKGDTVAKVGLQVQVWEHDEFGSGNVVQSWKDIERIKLPLL